MATIKVAQFAEAPTSDPNQRIPVNGIFDFHYQDIAASNVDATSRCILFLKLTVEKVPVQLRARLNATVVVDKDFAKTTEAFSFHELIDKNVLKTGNNELVISLSNNEGQIVISDVFIQYRSIQNV